MFKASWPRLDNASGDLLPGSSDLRRKPSECLRGNVTDYKCPCEHDPRLSLGEFGDFFRDLARVIQTFGSVFAAPS